MNPVILSYYAFYKHFINYTVNTLNGSTKVDFYILVLTVANSLRVCAMFVYCSCNSVRGFLDILSVKNWTSFKHDGFIGAVFLFSWYG